MAGIISCRPCHCRLSGMVDAHVARLFHIRVPEGMQVFMNNTASVKAVIGSVKIVKHNRFFMCCQKFS